MNLLQRDDDEMNSVSFSPLLFEWSEKQGGLCLVKMRFKDNCDYIACRLVIWA
jgi:hypothetical protein